DADRRQLQAEIADLTALVERLRVEREQLTRTIPRELVATFELVASRRNGIGVAEARDGICTICHVRLRPQVFNNIRRNDSIIQCGSAHRLLYFPPATTANAQGSVTQPAP